MGAWSEEAKARVRPRERALAIGLGHHPRCNRSFPKRLEPQFVAEARALWEEGFSTSAIGKRLGVTTSDVGEVVLRNDFPAARFPHPPECAMTSATAPILAAVRDALEASDTRAQAADTLATTLPGRVWRRPSARAELRSLIRDDRALGVTIVRRSPSSV